MKYNTGVIPLAVLGGLALSLATGAGAAARLRPSGVQGHAASTFCDPKNVKIKGVEAVVNCGPAVATLVYEGKTYHYTGGSCERQPGDSKLDLDLGTQVALPRNDGKQGFNVTLANSSLIQAIAAYGQPDIPNASIDAHGNIPKSGHFTGQTTSATGQPVKLSGSWDCRGSMVTLPG
jgi:hypothetical protein